MGKIILCADAESLRYPAMLGLEGESIEACPWIEAFSKASELRAYLKDAPGPCEVWVSSADDMDGVNIAAALKHDRCDHKVVLVGQRLSGSAMSRARAAGVDGALAADAFARRYAEEKRRRAGQAPLAGAAAGPADAVVGRGSASMGAMAFGADGASAAAAGSAATAPLPVASPAPAAQSAPAAAAPAAMPSPQAGRPAQRPVAGRSAVVLAVASGSGGAGRSAVSVTAACLAAAQGHRVLLLDCDLQFGDCALLCGAQGAPAMDALLADPSALARMEAPEGMPVVVGAPPRVEQAEVLAAGLPALLDAAAPLFDVVVACTGANWSEAHLQLLERSTAALLLVDQRIASVRACQRAVDLCVRCGIATGQFIYAVNRCSRSALFTSIDVSCALDGAHVTELKDGGREVEELLGAGAPAALLEAGNPFCESVEELLAAVVGPGAPLDGGSSLAAGMAGFPMGGSGPKRRRKRGKGPKAKASRRSAKRRRSAAPSAAPLRLGEVASWA